MEEILVDVERAAEACADWAFDFWLYPEHFPKYQDEGIRLSEFHAFRREGARRPQMRGARGFGARLPRGWHEGDDQARRAIGSP